jgi:hypothetical protein
MGLWKLRRVINLEPIRTRQLGVDQARGLRPEAARKCRSYAVVNKRGT